MREVNGELRGLLKKPNRSQTGSRNRVVFDETRNEFFEADYIILIRDDCTYEEGDEPCTCGEHEVVRLCCDEGCQCNYPTIVNKEQRNSKFLPKIECTDETALSPPDDYKDIGLKNAFNGSLNGHIFGSHHIQQLQVIHRLQQQRAAMLAARCNKPIPPPPPPPVRSEAIQHLYQQHHTQAKISEGENTGMCTECAECTECAAKQSQEADENIIAKTADIPTLALPAVAIVPLHASSPERRITEKEIIAGEERPKYVVQNQIKFQKAFGRQAAEDITPIHGDENESAETSTSAQNKNLQANHEDEENSNDSQAYVGLDSSPLHLNGILKGGKLWKQDSTSQMVIL